MAIGIGAAAALSGIGALGDVVSGLGSGFLSAHANRQLQIEDQEFNANQASIARDWQTWQNQLNRDWQTNANELAMNFNRQEAQANRAWSEHMYSTAMQQRVQDLRKAGLNPILAASSGLSSSTPSGATATGVATSPIGAGSASTAHGNAAHTQFNFAGFSKTVASFLRTAHEISKEADKYDDDFDDWYSDIERN